jgi:bifunctional non-homologous end joining protein LigD
MERRHSAGVCYELHECATIQQLSIRQESKGDPVKKNTSTQEELILHGVKITHPDRIVFEEGTITKGQVALYYAAVAPLLLRDIKSRPISLLRCPSGIKAECFYQRNVGFGLGADVYPFLWEYKAGATNISM